MTRQVQFGVRKNPAPHARQHGLRLAVDSNSAHALISEEPQFKENHTIASPGSELHASPHAASMDAATAGTCTDTSHLLSVSEVAQLLQVPISWVYARTRHRTKGRLPGYRLGKYWRFDRDEVLDWVQRQCKDFRAA